jgi:CRP-like cAMP-binding protein
MRTATFRAGDTILSEGEVGDTAYLINSGSVEVIVGKGNKARNVGTLEAGEVFGEMSLIDPGPRSATVRALSDTECVVTTYDELTDTFKEYPERAFEFMKTLAGRLRHMNQLVTTMQPGKRRLRDIFNDWADLYEDSRTATDKVEKMLHMV